MEDVSDTREMLRLHLSSRSDEYEELPQCSPNVFGRAALWFVAYVHPVCAIVLQLAAALRTPRRCLFMAE